ncbi:hypothetical protein WJX72_002168 [[Myrmecia] bisecta]|uniref:WW domain-containing protein n=1 Tax=[Myrmecia] bisecta TaxID=41462 RepID=A0AAW1Q4M9_9CHLO
MRKRASFSGPEEGGSNGVAAAAAGVPSSDQLDPPGGHAAPLNGLQANPGQTTVFVEIPTGMVGKVIGKQGETIKYLQNSTNSKIQIDHTTPGELKRVSITADTPAQANAAKAQIEQLVSDESAPGLGEITRSVDCPPGIVGRVIGRGGETIRALQQASQAHIVVDQNFPEGQPRKVNVNGKPDAVDRAVKMVTELINGEPGSAQVIIQKYGAGITKVVDCPKSMVGRVIGKGGETIKALQKQYGANIQIDQTTDPMKVTVSGQPMAVDQALAAVMEIIAGGNPPFLGGPGGPGGRGPGGYPPAYPAYSQGGYGGYGGYAAPVPAPAPAYNYYPGAGYPQAYAQPAAYGGYGGYGAADPYAAAGGYGASSGGYGAQASAQAAPQQPSSGSGVWQELQDGEGRSYYYNTQTGVSQWEKPADM